MDLPYQCPEHPEACVLHEWDQRHTVIAGYPAGRGCSRNHRWLCFDCGRELAAPCDHAGHEWESPGGAVVIGVSKCKRCGRTSRESDFPAHQAKHGRKG